MLNPIVRRMSTASRGINNPALRTEYQTKLQTIPPTNTPPDHPPILRTAFASTAPGAAVSNLGKFGRNALVLLSCGDSGSRRARSVRTASTRREFVGLRQTRRNRGIRNWTVRPGAGTEWGWDPVEPVAMQIALPKPELAKHMRECDTGRRLFDSVSSLSQIARDLAEKPLLRAIAQCRAFGTHSPKTGVAFRSPSFDSLAMSEPWNLLGNLGKWNRSWCLRPGLAGDHRNFLNRQRWTNPRPVLRPRGHLEFAHCHAPPEPQSNLICSPYQKCDRMVGIWALPEIHRRLRSERIAGRCRNPACRARGCLAGPALKNPPARQPLPILEWRCPRRLRRDRGRKCLGTPLAAWSLPSCS